MDLIIYHRGCMDGWCAAFVAKKKYPNAEFLACGYGDPLPIAEVSGRNVLVVDFSWPREQMLELCSAAKSLAVYDHHKTAQRELYGLDFAVFDMNKSGAGLTWDNLFSYFTRPWYVNYVEDHDLWRHNLPFSREVNLYLQSLPMNSEAWYELWDNHFSLSAALECGKGMHQYQQRIVERQFRNLQFGVWGCYVVGVVNASAEQSELGEKIYRETPADMAMLYHEDENRLVHFGLRSSSTQIPMVNVGELAHGFPGGGGHPNSAGFELPLRQARKFIDKLVRKN